MKHQQSNSNRRLGYISAANAACLGALLLVGCGVRFDPRGPGTDPSGPEESAAAANSDLTDAGGAAAAKQTPTRVRAVVRPTHTPDILVGEMCPRGAGGRASVMPLFLRSTTWSIDGEDVSLPIERRTARSFSILSWHGQRAGVFSVAGAADVGLERTVAIGAYAGDSPCVMPAEDDRPVSENAGSRPLEAACVRAQLGCGLAVASVDSSAMRPYEEDPDPLELPVGGACVAGGKLIVDLDGDGIKEAYAAASFLDPVRAPAEEVLAVTADGAQCSPAFAVSRVLTGRNPKHFRGMDLVGVLDIDNDGRSELIVAYHYSERRTWAVYTAASTVARLDLVGESVPWPMK